MFTASPVCERQILTAEPEYTTASMAEPPPVYTKAQSPRITSGHGSTRSTIPDRFGQVLDRIEKHSTNQDSGVNRDGDMSIFKRILRQVQIASQVDDKSNNDNITVMSADSGISNTIWAHEQWDHREIEFAAYALAHHEDLQPIYKQVKTSEITSWEIMDKSLARLVEDYGENLQQEATSKTEIIAARFIRQHSGSIASRAIEILILDDESGSISGNDDNGQGAVPPMTKIQDELAHCLRSLNDNDNNDDDGGDDDDDKDTDLSLDLDLDIDNIPEILDMWADADSEMEEPIEVDYVALTGVLVDAAQFAFSTRAFQTLKRNLAVAVKG